MYFMALNRAFAMQSGKFALRIEADIVAAGDELKQVITHVVTGMVVLGSDITQTDNQSDIGISWHIGISLWICGQQLAAGCRLQAGKS